VLLLEFFIVNYYFIQSW